MSGTTHIIIGAGPTGSATAHLLASTGRKVRVITRSGSGPDLPGVELVAADASDHDRLISLTTDAEAIYNCANPPYHRWTTDWPPLAASLLAAAEANGAVMVTLSNLYGYAHPTSPMRATDPLDPQSVKGAVRATMWHDALAAHQAGRVRVTEARASDFIGPGLGDNGHMGDRVINRIRNGKSVKVIGDPDLAHSWTAIADVARTLVMLATNESAWGRAWHVPTEPAMTQRELIHAMCETAGVAPVKVGSLPNAALRLAGLFIPAVREMQEIRYQFDAPFIIDSEETTTAFGLQATPLAHTLQATLGDHTQADRSTQSDPNGEELVTAH